MSAGDNSRLDELRVHIVQDLRTVVSEFGDDIVQQVSATVKEELVELRHSLHKGLRNMQNPSQAMRPSPSLDGVFSDSSREDDDAERKAAAKELPVVTPAAEGKVNQPAQVSPVMHFPATDFSSEASPVIVSSAGPATPQLFRAGSTPSALTPPRSPASRPSSKRASECPGRRRLSNAAFGVGDNLQIQPDEPANPELHEWAFQHRRGYMAIKASKMYKLDPTVNFNADQGESDANTLTPRKTLRLRKTQMQISDRSSEASQATMVAAGTEAGGDRRPRASMAVPNSRQSVALRRPPGRNASAELLCSTVYSNASRDEHSRGSTSDSSQAERYGSFLSGKLARTLTTLTSDDETWTACSSRRCREKSYRMRAKRFIDSNYFNGVVGITLVLNALSIGAQADITARTLDEVSWEWRVIEWVFCVVFVIEMFLRLFVYKLRFFYMDGWPWNVFDLFCVSLQFIEELASIFNDTTSGGAGSTTIFRMLRMIRLIRVMRFARVLHLIQELHTLVNSIVSSLNSFFWTVVLMFLMIFIVGVYITQIVADHRVSRKKEGNLVDNEALMMFWGNLGFTVLTLYEAMTGGLDWNDAVRPLMEEIGVWMAFVFSGYVALTVFVMMNLVTGIFVDSAAANIREDKDLRLVNSIRELFIKSDTDGTGSITWHEFVDQLQNPLMEEYFKVIDLDVSEARGFFDLLDLHGEGEVDSEDFVMGCLRLRGSARAIDLAILMDQSKIMFQQLRKLAGDVEKVCIKCDKALPSLPKSSLVRSGKGLANSGVKSTSFCSPRLEPVSSADVNPKSSPRLELPPSPQGKLEKGPKIRFLPNVPEGEDQVSDTSLAELRTASHADPDCISKGPAMLPTIAIGEGSLPYKEECSVDETAKPIPAAPQSPDDDPPALDTGSHFGLHRLARPNSAAVFNSQENVDAVPEGAEAEDM